MGFKPRVRVAVSACIQRSVLVINLRMLTLRAIDGRSLKRWFGGRQHLEVPSRSDSYTDLVNE